MLPFARVQRGVVVSSIGTRARARARPPACHSPHESRSFYRISVLEYARQELARVPPPYSRSVLCLSVRCASVFREMRREAALLPGRRVE